MCIGRCRCKIGVYGRVGCVLGYRAEVKQGFGRSSEYKTVAGTVASANCYSQLHLAQASHAFAPHKVCLHFQVPASQVSQAYVCLTLFCLLCFRAIRVSESELICTISQKCHGAEALEGVTSCEVATWAPFGWCVSKLACDGPIYVLVCSVGLVLHQGCTQVANV
jgi:hypothetical protein